MHVVADVFLRIGRDVGAVKCLDGLLAVLAQNLSVGCVDGGYAAQAGRTRWGGVAAWAIATLLPSGDRVGAAVTLIVAGGIALAIYAALQWGLRAPEFRGVTA